MSAAGPKRLFRQHSVDRWRVTATAALSSQSCEHKSGGAEGNRTPDLYNAIVALSQLSYGPEPWDAGGFTGGPKKETFH